MADDLLKNDGQKFLEMMEQLAERRMQREEEAAGDVEDDSEDDEDEDDRRRGAWWRVSCSPHLLMIHLPSLHRLATTLSSIYADKKSKKPPAADKGKEKEKDKPIPPSKLVPEVQELCRLIFSTK